VGLLVIEAVERLQAAGQPRDTPPADASPVES
jgi:hypothetical protein